MTFDMLISKLLKIDSNPILIIYQIIKDLELG